MNKQDDVEKALQPGSFGHLIGAITFLRDLGENWIREAPLENVGAACGTWLEHARKLYLSFNESAALKLLNDCDSSQGDLGRLCIALQSPQQRYDVLYQLNDMSTAITLCEVLRRDPSVYHAVAALSSLLTSTPSYAALVKPVGVDFGEILKELEHMETRFPVFVSQQGYRLIDVAGGLLSLGQRTDLLTAKFLLDGDWQTLDETASLLNRAIDFLERDGSLEWPIQEWWKIREGDSMRAILSALRTYTGFFRPVNEEFLKACAANGFHRSNSLVSTTLRYQRDESLGFLVYLPSPDVVLPAGWPAVDQELARSDVGRYLVEALKTWPLTGELSRLKSRLYILNRWRTQHRVAEVIGDSSTELAALGLTEAICQILNLPPEAKDILLIVVLGLVRSTKGQG